MPQGHLQDAITWITTTINNDSELAAAPYLLQDCYMYSAPEAAQYPFVIIGKQSGTHDYVMCGQAFATHYLAIKCVDLGFDGGERARLVMDRVQELIDMQKPTLTDGGYTMAIHANNSYEYDEQEAGNHNFYHSVINFRIVIGQ